MKTIPKSKKSVYFKLLDILSARPMQRRELISAYTAGLGLTREEMLDRSTGGRLNISRSIAGSAIDEMQRKGIISKGADGVYTAVEQKPVVIRNERCEKHLIRLLSERAMTKPMLRDALVKLFGTDKTLTERDDSKLFAVLSDILRRLTKDGIIILSDGYYSLPERIEAKVDDISGMLTLKESFLSRLHKRGGEFFENYFMTLLGKFVERHGKTVISNSTTGGSDDGGIDGIMTTVDILGFRETIMVQTKNRSDLSSETEVRGFFGAVCARQGSRGIFATSSDFHYSAKQFLDGIDNCVGINGDDIFKMAVEVSYGIRKAKDGLFVDDKVI